MLGGYVRPDAANMFGDEIALRTLELVSSSCLDGCHTFLSPIQLLDDLFHDWVGFRCHRLR